MIGNEYNAGMQYLSIKTLYLEVTHACNQRCRHCYLDAGMHHAVEEMSFAQIAGIIRAFHAQGGRYIIVTGGEPLVRGDIFDILDVMEGLRIPFCFASNSLALHGARLEKLAVYTCLDMYFTSILGRDAARHMHITGRDGYDRVLHALSFFEGKKVPVYVQVTLANAYIDDMEEIAETLLAFDNCTVKFTPIGTLGREDEENAELLIPQSAFPRFHEKIVALQARYPRWVEDGNILNFAQIAGLMDDYKDRELYALDYGFVAVRPNGDLSFSCNLGNPYVFGKAYEGLRIPIDGKLRDYIDALRYAEHAALEEAGRDIVELDVTVDRYIRAYHSKTELTIHKVLPADALAYTACHIACWQAAYKDIIPDDYLQNMPSELAQRAEHLIKNLGEQTDQFYYYVSLDRKMTGRLIFGKAHDADKPDAGEIGAIYLEETFWDRGYGRRMMDFAMDHLKSMGYREIIVWVLNENHRARRFYEKFHFVLDGAKQEIEIGKPMLMVRYVWELTQ